MRDRFGYTIRNKKYSIVSDENFGYTRYSKPVILKQMDALNDAISYMDWIMSCGDPKKAGKYNYWIEENNLKRNIGIKINEFLYNP